MKTINEGLAAAFAAETVKSCLCWRLTRPDGFVLGATDHDRALLVDGVSYEPSEALSEASFSQTADLRPGRGATAGVLSSDAISEDDLISGLWDRTEVAVFRVCWEQPELGGIPVWSGYLSDVTRNTTGAFEAELVSRKADLERLVGRVLQRRCDAALGDVRCGATGFGTQICDQRFETCRDVFQNTANFRGFPHLPGPDFVLMGPSDSGNDGGKR